MAYVEFGRFEDTRTVGTRVPPWYQASSETCLPIRGIDDIVTARHAGLMLVRSLNFSGSRMALVITAISELARNMLLYANCGEIILCQVDYDSRDAVMVMATDNGPGIADLESALSGGYSTSGGWGLGLSGLSHIANKFAIKSQPEAGTEVIVIIAAA